MYQILNGTANVLMALSMLCGALPLLLRTVRELTAMRADMHHLADRNLQAVREVEREVEGKSLD